MDIRMLRTFLTTIAAAILICIITFVIFTIYCTTFVFKLEYGLTLIGLTVSLLFLWIALDLIGDIIEYRERSNVSIIQLTPI